MPLGGGGEIKEVAGLSLAAGQGVAAGRASTFGKYGHGHGSGPKGKVLFFLNPIKVLRTGEEPFFEILRGQCLWALAHPAGWGVVEPGVLHPAEGTLLHAPRSVEEGPLR